MDTGAEHHRQINEFLLKAIAERVNQTSEAGARKSKQIVAVFGENANLPLMQDLSYLIHWRVQSLLWNRVLQAASSPADFERSLADVCRVVNGEVLAALRIHVDSPEPFQRAQQAARMSGYAQFLKEANCLAEAAKEKFPAPPQPDPAALLQVIQEAHAALGSDTADGGISARRLLETALARAEAVSGS